MSILNNKIDDLKKLKGALLNLEKMVNKLQEFMLD